VYPHEVCGLLRPRPKLQAQHEDIAQTCVHKGVWLDYVLTHIEQGHASTDRGVFRPAIFQWRDPAQKLVLPLETWLADIRNPIENYFVAETRCNKATNLWSWFN
jgi:hypothetical protein